MADAGVTWTDERVERLAKLWTEGLSASQIAAELGGNVSRNAVLGKIHRLGLAERGKTQATAAGRARKPLRPADSVPAEEPSRLNDVLASPAAPQPVASAPATSRPEVVVVPRSERVTIMELREFMCRWPLGDPTTAEFRFCGARAITGLPYCAAHAQVAYQPAAERKRLRA